MAMALENIQNSYAFEYSAGELEQKHSDSFSIHTSEWGEVFHRIAEIIFIPTDVTLQLFAYTIEPLPGENKEHVLRGIAIRITALALCLLSIPISLISTPLYFGIAACASASRKDVSYIHNEDVEEKEPPALTVDNPLHIRTHNTGLVSPYISTIGDLLPPTTRAKMLLENVVNDPHQPDVICFQEVFDEASARILVEGLKTVYPHIIYNIGQDAYSRLNSGLLIASKYPPQELRFDPHDHMIGPERLSHRGLLRLTIDGANNQKVHLYCAHLQALIGQKRSEAREKQLADIKKTMKRDKRDDCHQVLVGDLNISSVTAWGEDVHNPGKQSDEKSLHFVEKHFVDIYKQDHTSPTGIRTSGTPQFLAADNQRMGFDDGEDLEEPSGSWYLGPFATGIKSQLIHSKMAYDRRQHKKQPPKKIEKLHSQEITWGTPKWFSDQRANTARFDYILTPKGERLTGRAEIRRVAVDKEAQSAPSDHLPVDAMLYLT